jgi:hypothetical protein
MTSHIVGEKSLPAIHSINRLRKFILQRINIPMKKWAHELNREFLKERGANKYKNKCSTSLVIKEM